MTLDALIMFAGALVALVPFLGFPNSWDTYIFLALGVLIVIFGIILRRRAGKKTVRAETFVESTPQSHE